MNWNKQLFLLRIEVSTKQNSLSQTKASDITTNFPSLDIATDFTKDLLPDQMTRANAIDSKANFILGAATTIISASLIILPSILTSRTHCSMFVPSFFPILPPILRRVTLVLPLTIIYLMVIGLMITYLIVMGYAYQGYKIRDYIIVPDPVKVYKSGLLRKPEDYTKAVIFQEMRDAFDHNEKIIIKKSNYIYKAFAVLMIEVLVLIGLLAFRIIC